MAETKREKFVALCSEAQGCRVCPDLADKTAVLSEMNGSISPKVFFIAEAPGRQGADRTRRPFYGDKSGENFQKFLDSIGLSRDEIFITNTVLCSPRKESGANRKPTKKEIANCSGFLIRQIELIAPKVVVTLGSVALEALKGIETHEFTPKENAGMILDWNGRKLIPLYHPSPQVIISVRSFEQQMKDFKAVGKAIKGI